MKVTIKPINNNISGRSGFDDANSAACSCIACVSKDPENDTTKNNKRAIMLHTIRPIAVFPKSCRLERVCGLSCKLFPMVIWKY